MAPSAGWPSVDFFHDNFEMRQRCWPEGCRERDIRGITPPRHQNPSEARQIIAHIDGPPATAEIDLAPGTEIHGMRIFRHPDITEITGAISGGWQMSSIGDEAYRST